MAQDPWAEFRPNNQLPTQPQPLPGAKTVPIRKAPAKAATEARTVQQTVFDANQDARAEEGIRIERERIRIAKEKADRDKKAAEENGGVETTASQDMAAGHTVMLGDSLATLKRVAKKNPEALQPGWTEKGVKWLTNNDPDFVAYAQSADRQAADTAQKTAVESAIYLSTGAAAPEDQVKRIASTIIPAMGDEASTRELKMHKLKVYIGQARARAGPADVKAQAALTELEQQLPELYGVNEASKQNFNNIWGQENAPEVKPAEKFKSVPIPEEMQAKYDAWLQAHPPGSVKVEDYQQMYTGLLKEYGFTPDPTAPADSWGAWVDSYNKGFAHTTIPMAQIPLTADEQERAANANTPSGTFIRNTGSALAGNLPKLMLDREGRYANEIIDREHPKSAIAGQVAGSIIPIGMLERGAEKVLARGGAATLAQRIGAETAANTAYGGVSGYSSAEPENRNKEGLLGAGIGAGTALAARAAIQGAKGYLNSTTLKSMDELGARDFELPGGREPLPADDITPPRFQSLTDDELRSEIQHSQRGIDAWGAQDNLVKQNAAGRQALKTEAETTARQNAQQQERFVRENFRSTQPEQIAAIRAEAERLYPTDPEAIMASVDFARRAKGLVDPDPGAMEPPGVLQARINRLEEHLLQDPATKTGRVPEVDLTTLQRAGMGSQEEALQGIPGVHGAREKAVESWNRQNSARVLARIGEELPKDLPPGQATNAYVNKQLNAAYNTLRPSIKGRIDESFSNAVAALRRKALGNNSPERTALWAEIEDALQKFRRPDGTFDGEGYRELSTQLRRLNEVWTSDRSPTMTTSAQDMARVSDQVRKQAQALVNRANPAAGKRLKTLEGAWAHQTRIEAASRGAAKSTEGVYAPDEYLNAIERLDTSRNKAAVARGQGFDQAYGQAARKVMAGKPAKKASLRETMLGMASLHFGGAPAALLATGAGAGYVPGLKRIMQALVDGKLGATPAVVTKNLEKSKAGKRILSMIDGNARTRLTAQSLRTLLQQREPGE